MGKKKGIPIKGTGDKSIPIGKKTSIKKEVKVMMKTYSVRKKRK